ncbi:M14 metallopeptidase family protein [Lentiprolixibacter aurantiacus]|uniref:M14 family metallopeptidase n=1 Tax=Lentiprolixibacter aurantiacus TaxID=2993939 RepID=A0AAE3MNC6_9FLAO|nr:M14 metallopeptidase family protein [Lentiprolixibacter aurantiacus]MCX2720054.1 M14 family metallopeptidase [Lentiprolixibacter aurantiacus]
MSKTLVGVLLFCTQVFYAQDYFFKKYHPFQSKIPSPEAYLGYPIGAHHTRHDRIVDYLEMLSVVSDRASLINYGRTHEGRRLVMLVISSPENMEALPEIKERHLAYTRPNASLAPDPELPVFVNLAYNVHGNEPSSSEAALLTAYTLTASNNPEILNYLNNAVILVDPTINPDGRDRHTHWANMYQGNPLVIDPQDAEHNEYWPGGRTNHYWFDLNRDWLLAINPESRGKLNWYHEWYPNVVTDFHEMGTQSTYFFEPMKINGSLNPIMPRENYEDLNNLFGEYYSKALDSIGSLYFTKEVFDGTYPGYGSSYPDLQGGLGLLFEQASSRGHKQKTAFGEITFPFTIRNQYTSSITTLKAAVENKDYLYQYQQDFFKSAIRNAEKSKIKGYRFGDAYDKNRLKAFIDKLLIHKIEVYKADNGEYVVPTSQPQYRMVQTVFETYDKYRDSVYYDASAWSVANFYNIKYRPVNTLKRGDQISGTDNLVKVQPIQRSEYAYLIDWDDYNAPAVLNQLQSEGLVVSASFKPFTAVVAGVSKTFNYGTLMVPVSLQKKSPDEIFALLGQAQKKFQVPMYAVETGYNLQGIDLGSGFISPLNNTKVAMLIGTGVRPYEAGEVWHLLDTRVGMPITKIPMRNFNRVNFDKYNTLVMVSGNYSLTDKQQTVVKDWVKKGNTLITIGTASEWIIKKKWVKEKLIESKADSTKATVRQPYVDARENLGKESVGGIIARTDLDISHPLGFGYRNPTLPVYKNNTVWLAPSQNEYATVAKYSSDPHIDGFITKRNLEEFLKPAASLIVSPMGSGRVVMFADNPNFRGSWYGTNRLFLNALFLGQKINIPKRN